MMVRREMEFMRRMMIRILACVLLQVDLVDASHREMVQRRKAGSTMRNRSNRKSSGC
jgi:hypothetical protein